MKIEDVLKGVRKVVKEPPYVQTLADPFEVLISTVLSARARDETTAEVCELLFREVRSFRELKEIPLKRLEAIIKKSGFYKTKARYLKGIADRVLNDFGGRVPDTMEGLLSLPGVGRKTANLVLIAAFGRLEHICVDTHVHRISNRTGVVMTRNPEQTEMKLMKVAPRRLWAEINRLLVPFGKAVCTPLSPKCSGCPLGGGCPQVGVGRSR